jgi:hypothetical protein
MHVGFFAISLLATLPVVEFYNAALDHYFISVDTREADGSLTESSGLPLESAHHDRLDDPAL